MNIKEVKSTLRKQCLALLKAQPAHERHIKSELITNTLLELDALKRISVIMTYVSDNYEVETHSLIRTLLGKGKKIVIPYLDEMKNIIPCQINDLDRDTELSWYGYLEPKQDCRQKPFKKEDVELILVPGLAFDKKGHRLGRGWGCYDRFLASLRPNVQTFGLAFDFQICPTIPTEANDVIVSRVLSN
ncbi:MAG: 5-formyltetrahydrofolate cyclo-ligase [Candidatus Omnitrophica bacterium]|nr:5-formyltetrahydrofolate cyclo-ligase [Candidatus Omnitrophota bacterium]